MKMTRGNSWSDFEIRFSALIRFSASERKGDMYVVYSLSCWKGTFQLESYRLSRGRGIAVLGSFEAILGHCGRGYEEENTRQVVHFYDWSTAT